MSDYNDDDLDTQDETTEPKRNWRRDLEEQARAAKQASAEAETAKRELAFYKAGIDLDSPQGKLFAKAYDGANDAASVKAAALEYGIVQPDAPVVDAAELAAHDRIADASAGASQVSETDAAMAELNAAGDWRPWDPNGGNPQKVLEVLAKNGVPIETSKPGPWLRPEGQGTRPL